MDNSTENVSLLAIFILDILNELDKRQIDKTEILMFCNDYDISIPYNSVPIDVYNQMCYWIEENLGDEVLISIGRSIGETIFAALLENKIVVDESSPKETMEGLMIAASSMIQDEKDRGWEMVIAENDFLQMRRTQTFNSKLQIGLLKGLIEKCENVKEVEVGYVKEVAKGDAYDEYLITWKK